MPRIYNVMLQQITHGSIVRVLIAGFALVILLFLAAGYIAVQNAGSIRESAANLVAEQLVASRLVDEIQREQTTLSAVLYNLERGADPKEQAEILEQLDTAASHIDRIIASLPKDADAASWTDFQNATRTFLDEARAALRRGYLSESSSLGLFSRHQEVVAIVARLSAASETNATLAQVQIDRRAEDLVNKSFLLLGGALLLAMVCVGLTVQAATALFRKMEWQTGELSRVSWNMVESQEITARRFSHELHDELGQSLSAIKVNLAYLEVDAVPGRKERLRDCIQVADEAIQNVRQLSQLLHPVILDDFGLDAGLRWLCEGFTTRTGIEARYHCTFKGRLPGESETHVFRIAQEALTNVARHSGASRVDMNLEAPDGMVRLIISDNGSGINTDAAKGGVGLIGMRARARSVGGDLKMRSTPGGVTIEVEVPQVVLEDEENSHTPDR